MDYVDIMGRAWPKWNKVWPYAITVSYYEGGSRGENQTYVWCMRQFGSSLFRERPEWMAFTGFVGDRLCEKFTFADKAMAAKFMLMWSHIVIFSENFDDVGLAH